MIILTEAVVVNPRVTSNHVPFGAGSARVDVHASLAPRVIRMATRWLYLRGRGEGRRRVMLRLASVVLYCTFDLLMRVDSNLISSSQTGCCFKLLQEWQVSPDCTLLNQCHGVSERTYSSSSSSSASSSSSSSFCLLGAFDSFGCSVFPTASLQIVSSSPIKSFPFAIASLTLS